MRNYLKLLVMKIDTYESEILMEYNLFNKEEVKDKMQRYTYNKDIVGVVIHME